MPFTESRIPTPGSLEQGMERVKGIEPSYAAWEAAVPESRIPNPESRIPNPESRHSAGRGAALGDEALARQVFVQFQW